MALGDREVTHPRGQPGAAQPDPARLVGDERLPCGHLVSQAWEDARTGRADPHLANCPHCRQAVEGLAALDRATRTLRAYLPSARSVADHVIRAVRAEARLGWMVPLDDPERDLRVAETTAARVLRRAADRIPGVRAASCRLAPADDATGVTVAMTLAMTLDQSLPGRAGQVRRAVADAAQRELGLAVSGIDLNVASVLQLLSAPVRGASPSHDRSE
ncbi:hypothetical protein SAMN05216223_12911 [Actinacidiphila yanglinensis]|uniref:Asp23/Gls24 family envelope stress response protein n=1 Tax=Actinacidiphila yanglinensis TaxID=310779 RepID=A0A1H6E8H9_9ACTN|nr:hypothetical protein [Actinacidiphila yanglinensis]SEG94007.1 hypothetical protein SAMN05216223_12911 [Actinacidiphila yanglinensis]